MLLVDKMKIEKICLFEKVISKF